MIGDLGGENAPLSLPQRLLHSIAVYRLFIKGGDLVAKVLVFFLELLYMMSLTFYAVANSAIIHDLTYSIQGGIVFLYGLTIGTTWLILLIILQILNDRKISIAGKLPLVFLLVIVLIIIFFSVLIASIVENASNYIGGGTLVGYFVLTWLLTECVQLIAVFIQYKCGYRSDRSALEFDDADDEYAENRGTFQGIDENVAIQGGVDETSNGGTLDPENASDEFESDMGSLQVDEDLEPNEDDLGLL